jgi:hypothetical protein
MDDRTFFDHLFQMFTRTTGAENMFWKYERDLKYFDGGPAVFLIKAVDQEGNEEFVGSLHSEADADFITAVHGCFPDLVRRLHDALDEADRADTNRDEREQEVFRLALENQELREECARLEETIATARSKAADVLWKIERPM